MNSTYNIRFGRRDGSLACLLVIGRASDTAAMQLAHSMTGSLYEQVEIWRGEHCVHTSCLAQMNEIAAA